MVLSLAQVKLHKKIWTTRVAFDASTVAAGISYIEISLIAIDSLYRLDAGSHTITNLEVL